MAVRVHIPAQIRRLYGAEAWEEVDARSVEALIRLLNERFPGMRERLVEPDGHMRRWVNIYVDGEDIRVLAGVTTPLVAGAEVYIVPSVAGGR